MASPNNAGMSIPRSPRKDWQAILARARTIVAGYDTGVTLRQLFYRLVSDGTLRNTDSNYKSLSRQTAAARRAGEFPALIDNTREIHRPLAFENPNHALGALTRQYRRDRTEGQAWQVYLGIEKDGLTTLLGLWFGRYGLPVVVTRGYSSQTYVDEIVASIELDGRPAVLLYGGDFDPSGEDIQRDFVQRVGLFDHVERIALTPDQVVAYDLPPQPGKRSDSRAKAFKERHGQLVQVEIDALDPGDLRTLYREAIEGYFDVSIWDLSTKREYEERLALAALRV